MNNDGDDGDDDNDHDHDHDDNKLTSFTFSTVLITIFAYSSFAYSSQYCSH